MQPPKDIRLTQLISAVVRLLWHNSCLCAKGCAASLALPVVEFVGIHTGLLDRSEILVDMDKEDHREKLIRSILDDIYMRDDASPIADHFRQRITWAMVLGKLDIEEPRKLAEAEADGGPPAREILVARLNERGIQ